MYSLISYKCDNCCALLLVCCGIIFFCVSCSFFETISFLKSSLKIIERRNASVVGVFAFGVLLHCSSTVAVLLGSPAPLWSRKLGLGLGLGLKTSALKYEQAVLVH